LATQDSLAYGEDRSSSDRGLLKDFPEMSIARHIFAVALGASLLSGCARSGFPDVTSSISQAALNAPWPEFLPADVILSGDIVDFERSLAEIRSLEGRANALRRRAKLLRGPVVTIQERLRLQQAVNTGTR
jgi:hypothetical protein